MIITVNNEIMLRINVTIKGSRKCNLQRMNQLISVKSREKLSLFSPDLNKIFSPAF